MKSAFATSATLAVTAASVHPIWPNPLKDDNKATVGVNIGGWLVLEPWITPSLFYRFLGKTKSDGVGIDTYTFCSALGAEEANKVLRAHWDAWVTEDHIKQLADREVEIVRLPIGDWTLRQYESYQDCTTGADEKVQWLLDTADKYGIKVLLDVHGVKDSQNGFDNSGKSVPFTWIDENNFTHANGYGEWMGPWNGSSYDYIKQENIDWAVETIDMLVDKWGKHPALFAIEPVNEPWWNSDLNVLKDFYRKVRTNMRNKAPHLHFVFHDAFHWDANEWNDLFADNDKDNVIMDTHQYMAWWSMHNDVDSLMRDYRSNIANTASQVKYPVWVGEWALATDQCAFWLEGFNNFNGTDKHECQWVDCPYSYLPEEFAVDFDRTADMLGPYGEDPQKRSVVRKGKCSIDSAFFGESDVYKLGQSLIQTFNNSIEGHFMWTFRNELEPRWNYITAYDNGWIKNGGRE